MSQFNKKPIVNDKGEYDVTLASWPFFFKQITKNFHYRRLSDLRIVS